MIQIAPGVRLLGGGAAPYAINMYVIGDVLLDSGTRWSWRRLRRELAGVALAAHALTHGHPDHQGCSRRVCETYDVPLWCGAGDADAVESGDWLSLLPDNPLTRYGGRVWAGPPCPVARRLVEGDEVGGFEVLETPGHSPGHISLWREDDGVLLTGDVVANFTPWLVRRGEPMLPPWFFTPEPERNVASARRLAALRPQTVCFNHGPPMRDPAPFMRFVERLGAS